MALSERADRLLESDDSNDGSILNDNKFKTNVIKFLRNILTKIEGIEGLVEQIQRRAIDKSTTQALVIKPKKSFKLILLSQQKK
jgi:hypothetical protein